VFNESVTHHLNEVTLDAFQHEVATNILSTEFIDVFTRYCDDSYSSGVSDVNLKDFSEIPLTLRSWLSLLSSNRLRLIHCGKSCSAPDQTRRS
jgi:hypothetical protein